MEWYNKDVFYLFLGGLFSIALPVAINFSRRGSKRSDKRKELNKLKELGQFDSDIESWLNSSFEYKIPNGFQLFTEWGLQPLLIIVISALFSNGGPLLSIWLFFVILLLILHEWWLNEEFSNKYLYQLFMLLFWIASYLVICNSPKINSSERTKDKINVPVTKPDTTHSK